MHIKSDLTSHLMLRKIINLSAGTITTAAPAAASVTTTQFLLDYLSSVSNLASHFHSLIKSTPLRSVAIIFHENLINSTTKLS